MKNIIKQYVYYNPKDNELRVSIMEPSSLKLFQEYFGVKAPFVLIGKF